MRWTELCAAYPAQWVVIEKRHAEDELALIELCGDGRAAMHRFRELRRVLPGRTLCCIHTSYPSLSFDELAASDDASHDHHVA